MTSLFDMDEYGVVYAEVTDSQLDELCGRSRNDIDTRLIRFPPRTEFTPHRDAGMRGGNDIVILRHLYLPAPPCLLACTCQSLEVDVLLLTGLTYD